MSGGNRAEKSGFAAEAQRKVESKWDTNAAMDAMNWVSQSTGMPLPDGYSGSSSETQSFLKDGYVLAKLTEYASPGSVKASLLTKPPTMAFKQMELIGKFLSIIKDKDLVKSTELFQTVDLYESTNMPMVIITISSLGRKLQDQNRGYGKAESVGEKKVWTEEQLKAGQNVIGLQMGTNQGASQAGMSFGKTRKIMD